MKKIFLIAALLMAASVASAQRYRGFLDLYGGIGTGKGVSVSYDGLMLDKIKPDYAFGLTTSHGCQVLPYLYVGVGVGANIAFSGADPYFDTPDYKGMGNRSTKIYGVYVPAFLDLRWDLDTDRRFTPFVGVKIGHQFGITVESGGHDRGYSWRTDSYNWSEDYVSESLFLYPSAASGFYFMPTVGCRFRIGAKTGLNLGLSYIPSVGSDIRVEYERQSPTEYKSEQVYEERHKIGALMLSLGLDF